MSINKEEGRIDLIDQFKRGTGQEGTTNDLMGLRLFVGPFYPAILKLIGLMVFSSFRVLRHNLQ